MKNHKEMFEALLSGETLEGQHNGYLIKLSVKGELLASENGSSNFVYFHNTKAIIDRHEDYTIKPKTININGFEVPEPVREHLEPGIEYYMATIAGNNLYDTWIWENDVYDNHHLTMGLIHLRKENAIKHTEALLSFTRKSK